MPHAKTAALPCPELTFTLPEGDVGALTGLSDASQVRAWTQHKVAEYQNHISTLLAIYNSVAPMSTLPTEILQEIFARIPCVATWCDALWLLSLGLVCRRWHSILLSTPKYWAWGLHTVMDPSYYMYYRGNKCSDGPDEFDDNAIVQGRALFLARSAPWPLEIYLPYSMDGPGWEAFKGHFDRVNVFEVVAHDGDELDDILDTVTSSMKRLERLRIDAYYLTSSQLLFDWEAEDLPRLGCLEITSSLFCCVTTVPSLHTVILTAPPRDIKSLPQLFAALEKCPALATLRLELTHKDDTFQNRVLKRVLNLPNLRTLDVGGGISDVRCFLSGLSFPSTALVELDIIGTGNEQDRGLVLPNVLPRSLPAVCVLDGIDRLCFYSNHPALPENQRAGVSMQGYAQGAQRLRIVPAFWFHSASHFLRILTLFKDRGVAELALDLRYTPSDIDGGFWTKFFAALPDLRRLELLSRTVASRATKHDIAAHYLASRRALLPAPETDAADSLYRITHPRRTTSLAWVLCTDEGDAALLEAELSDVEQVLRDHANSGARADRLELYVTTPSLPHSYEAQALDVTHVKADCRASRLVGKEYVSRLQAAAEVVVIGGGWRSAEDDEELNVDAR